MSEGSPIVSKRRCRSTRRSDSADRPSFSCARKSADEIHTRRWSSRGSTRCRFACSGRAATCSSATRVCAASSFTRRVSIEVVFDEMGIVDAGAGIHFPALVRRTAARGLRGLEPGVGYPRLARWCSDDERGRVSVLDRRARRPKSWPSRSRKGKSRSRETRSIFVTARRRSVPISSSPSARLALTPDEPHAAIKADMDRAHAVSQRDPARRRQERRLHFQKPRGRLGGQDSSTS